MKLNPKIKQQIIKYFQEKPEVAAAYLYGSYARGDARPDSDIDLAVLVTDKSKYTGFGIVQVVFAADLTKVVGIKVEVNDLDSCRVDFSHRVLTEGRLLVSNNEDARVNFEEKIIKNYFDLQPILNEYYSNLSDIARKGEIGVRYI